MPLHATRLPKRLFTITASLLLLLLLAASAQAQHQVTTCGTIITEPGEWNLVNDLNCTGVDGITVSASDVVLNLNDHEITGSPTNIGIYTREHDRIRIAGPGIIHGFSIGVLNEGGHAVEVGGVLVTHASVAGFVARGGQDLRWVLNGAQANPIGFWVQSGRSFMIETNAAHDNAGDGFNIAGEDIRVTDDNEAINNGAVGINLSAGAKNSSVRFNRSFGNDIFDLADQNPNCGSDHWHNNEAITRNQPGCVH
jgi:hypothetical protein